VYFALTKFDPETRPDWVEVAGVVRVGATVE